MSDETVTAGVPQSSVDAAEASLLFCTLILEEQDRAEPAAACAAVGAFLLDQQELGDAGRTLTTIAGSAYELSMVVQRLGRRDRIILCPVFADPAAAAAAERLAESLRSEEGSARTLVYSGGGALHLRCSLADKRLAGEAEDEERAGRLAAALTEALPGLRAELLEVRDQHAVILVASDDVNMTPLHRLLPVVRDEAARWGYAFDHCEPIGLLPDRALLEQLAAALATPEVAADRLLSWRATRALEARRRAEAAQRRARAASGSLAVMPIEDYVEALASAAAVPGGGAAAAVTAAQGAAMVAMLARLTLGKPKYADAQERMEAIVAEADRARAEFLELASEDAAAFASVMEAYHLPRTTEEERARREEAVRTALLTASKVPLTLASRAEAMMPLAKTAIDIGNRQAASDGATGGQLLAAAVESALYNVDFNLSGMDDDPAVLSLRVEAEAIRRRARQNLSSITSALRHAL